MEIFTIGHSTLSKKEFIEILKTYDIQTLVDVRSQPGSRYVPHFNKEDLKKWLVDNGIAYIHILGLGGHRKNISDIDYTLVDGWKHSAFRNYAAYALTDEFEESLNELIDLSKKFKVCIMCAESVPWRCHRLIISNALIAKNLNVNHIIGNNKIIPHRLGMYGAPAKIFNSKVVYPTKQ